MAKAQNLTVSAVPVYFATMALERWLLGRRARRTGPQPADYEARDTAVSLTMGTASLVLPMVVPPLLNRVVRGRRGSVRRAILLATAGTALVTTVADRLTAQRHGPEGATAGSPQLPRRLRRSIETVRATGGVTSVVLGGITAATLWAQWTTDEKLWSHRILKDLGTGPLTALAAIVGWDFIYYWNHRLQHESRFLWAIHVVHHSSERYNLSTALRQPVTDALGTFIPTGVLGVLGLQPALIEMARGVNLLYQYWIHTELVGHLGPVEKAFNTPSHHRVHHGSNPRYIDRNHGSILIVWDRLFGTFEEEGERAVYGLTKNIHTFNPLRVATHEHVEILRDVARSTSWGERLSFVLRGPGWAYSRHAEQLAETNADDASGNTERSPDLAAVG